MFFSSCDCNLMSSPPSPPLHAATPPTLTNVARDDHDDGAPGQGPLLRRLHQLPLPVAKGTEATVTAAPTWKRTLPAFRGIASPLEPAAPLDDAALPPLGQKVLDI